MEIIHSAASSGIMRYCVVILRKILLKGICFLLSINTTLDYCADITVIWNPNPA